MWISARLCIRVCLREWMIMAKACNHSLDIGKRNHPPFHRQRLLRPPYDQALFLDRERVKFLRADFWTLRFPFDQVITYHSLVQFVQISAPISRLLHTIPLPYAYLHTRSILQYTLSNLKPGCILHIYVHTNKNDMAVNPS